MFANTFDAQQICISFEKLFFNCLSKIKSDWLDPEIFRSPRTIYILPAFVVECFGSNQNR